MHISRHRAVVLHLVASIAMAALFLFLTIFVWYPAPLFKVEGTLSVVRVLLGIQIIVAPLLTLLVFKPGKPGLKLDMAIIIALQLGAFAYGAGVVIKERAVIVSFAVDRFVVISAAEAKELEMDRIDAERVTLQAIGPTYVYAEMPEDVDEKQELMFGVLQGEPDLEKRPEYYRDFHSNIERSFPVAMDLQKHAEKFGHTRVEVEKYLKRSGKSYDDIAAYPVTGKQHDMVLVVDRQSKSLAGSIDIDPWERK